MSRRALVIVDMQNDFLPGGSLPVPGGDEVVSTLNRFIERFAQEGSPILATRDWHPAETTHTSRHRAAPGRSTASRVRMARNSTATSAYRTRRA